jgi:hypothetical protein
LKHYRKYHRRRYDDSVEESALGIGPSSSHNLTLSSDEDEVWVPVPSPHTYDQPNDDTTLPSEKRRKDAFYDYPAPKQTIHEEAKHFYQRIQSDSQNEGLDIDNGQQATPGLSVSKESSLEAAHVGSESEDFLDPRRDGGPEPTPPSGSEGVRFAALTKKAVVAVPEPGPGLGLEIDQISDSGSSPIAIAAQEGKKEQLELLPRTRANINAPGRTYGPALEAAGQIGDQEPIQRSFENDVKVHDEDGFQSLAEAVRSYTVDMPRYTSVYNTTTPSHGATRLLLGVSDDERVSTYAESVFSSDSMGSSATGLSSTSAYTDAEIVTATRELVNIFIEDSILRQLYQSALEDPRIGPDRLKRNLYRLLKKYAQNLQQNANGELERLAAQLVAVKARYVTQCVMERFYIRPVSQQRRKDASEELKDDSEEEDNQEDDDLPAIDEDRFEDIVVLHQFLVENVAFRLLQEQLKSFVQPKRSISPYNKTRFQSQVQSAKQIADAVLSGVPEEQLDEPESNSLDRHALHVGSQVVKAPDMRSTGDASSFSSAVTNRWQLSALLQRIAVTLGFSEPPLQPDTVRLRWQCVSNKATFRLHCTTRQKILRVLTFNRNAATLFSKT